MLYTFDGEQSFWKAKKSVRRGKYLPEREKSLHVFHMSLYMTSKPSLYVSKEDEHHSYPNLRKSGFNSPDAFIQTLSFIYLDLGF